MCEFSRLKNSRVIRSKYMSVFFFFKCRACNLDIAVLSLNFFHYLYNALKTFATKINILA